MKAKDLADLEPFMRIPSAVAAMAALEERTNNLDGFLAHLNPLQMDELGATPSRIAKGLPITVEDINAVVYAAGVESSQRTMDLLNNMPSNRPLSSLMVVTRNEHPAISATSAYKRTAHEISWTDEADSHMAS